jgi:hypothetical protein
MKRFLVLLALISTFAGAQPAPVVINSAGQLQRAGAGIFPGSPNYVGNGSDSSFAVIQGSSAAPSTTQGATVVVSKTANTAAFNAFAAFAYKRSTSANARGTAIYAEAVDPVGGDNSFVEGLRTQAVLLTGNLGSAYGSVSAAGTASSGPTSPKYLIGHEAEVDDQIGPDAPTFGSFDKDTVTATYVATNGNGGGTRYKADAAFLTNPYSMQRFQTGILFGETSLSDTGIAFRSNVIVNGIDMHLATFSGFAINSSGFTVDGDGDTTARTVKLAAFTVATLPTCNAGAAGTVAYVTDATAPTYNASLTGGGAVKALAMCNGSGWTAH